MKLVLIMALLSSTAWAQNKASKTYTETEFTKAVAEQVRKKVDEVKNKSVSDLTKELITKEESIRLRELELEKREDQIKVNSAEIEKKIKVFNTQQTSVLGCVERNDEELKTRISQQVDVVSNMKPEKAAQLLSVQDANIAVQILQLLDHKKASKIFNLMEKEVSARLQKQYMDMKR
jgi:flagellar motility protein MotE (MotC chaperone)